MCKWQGFGAASGASVSTSKMYSTNTRSYPTHLVEAPLPLSQLCLPNRGGGGGDGLVKKGVKNDQKGKGHKERTRSTLARDREGTRVFFHGVQACGLNVSDGKETADISEIAFV